MGSFFSHLILKPILKTKLLKAKSLTSMPISSFWARSLFTKTELQVLSSDFGIRNKNRPFISVIVIHHDANRVPWLVECIESIQSQLYSDFEIVVVANYEFSPQVRDSIKSLNVAKLLFFKNSHPSQARNYGIQNCESQLVAFVDDDNLLLPWHLLFLANAYQTDPEAVIYIGSYLCFQNESLTNFPLRYPVNRRTLLLGDPTDVSSVAFKRSSFPAIHWDDQVLSENWAFLVDALDIGFKVHQISAPLSLHRNHPQSRTKKLERPLVPFEWFKKYRKDINWGFDIPDSTGKAKLLKVTHALSTTIDS
jgi:glycosyltransferase involved in cell wall biosynthesis